MTGLLIEISVSNSLLSGWPQKQSEGEVAGKEYKGRRVPSKVGTEITSCLLTY